MDLNSCLIQTRNRRYFALLVLKANLAELLLCARYADCNVFRDYCSLHSCFIYYTQLHNRSTAAVPLVPVKLRSLALQEQTKQTHYKVQNSANYPVFGFENLALLSIMPASSGNLCKHAIKFVAMSHRDGI